MPKPKTKDEEKDKALPIIIIGGLSAFLTWLFFRGRAHAVDPDKAILYGLVTDVETGALIKDINVECDGYTGITNASGEYQIINIEPGTYSVIFTDPLGRYAPQEV